VHQGSFQEHNQEQRIALYAQQAISRPERALLCRLPAIFVFLALMHMLVQLRAHSTTKAHLQMKAALKSTSGVRLAISRSKAHPVAILARLAHLQQALREDVSPVVLALMHPKKPCLAAYLVKTAK
jgi:hypothetical protein